MADTREMVDRIYAAFNRRDVEALFAQMRDDVSWPTASEGGRVVGKEAVRAYWTRQWQAFDPHVEPMQVQERAPDSFTVHVRQVVKTLGGDLLSDSEVRHTYMLLDGLVARMTIEADGSDTDRPSAAFAPSH